MATPGTIGFVGLGQMGQPMASLIAKGDTPTVGFDLIKDRTPHGVKGAESLQDLVVQADSIFLSLPDGNAVNTVVKHIAAMNDQKGKTIIDLSTIGPESAMENATLLQAEDITYIDAPVSGGRRGALNGSITIMWAGAKSELDRHNHILELFSANTFHVGDSPGQGQAVKLLNNFLSATAMAASSEAILFGLSHGVEMKTILDVVNVSTGNNTAIADKFPNRILTGTYDAGFYTELLNKDVQLFRRFVKEAGTPNQITNQVAHVWQHVEQALPPQSDFTRIYEVMEKGIKS